MLVDSPRVSAIFIVFNGGEFLDEAISSVIGQLSTDWELLVIDDGSSDSSPQIARFRADADSRIRLLSHPDGRIHGMSASRNLGLAQAQGEFVGFLDAEDVWLPERLVEQVAILKRERSAGMICGRTLI